MAKKRLGLEVKTSKREAGIRWDAGLVSPEEKDRLLENLLRVFGILVFGFIQFSSGQLNPWTIAPCIAGFILAGISNLKYFQRGKNLEVRFW